MARVSVVRTQTIRLDRGLIFLGGILIALVAIIMVLAGPGEEEPGVIQVFGYDDAYNEDIIGSLPVSLSSG